MDTVSGTTSRSVVHERRVLCMLAIVVSVCWCQVARAEEHFVVGVEELNYYPQYAWDAQAAAGSQYKGYARDVLDAFAKAKGYTFTYAAYPVARLFHEFLEGQSLDFKYPDNTYWSAEEKKEHKVVYSDPVVAYVDGVMTLPAHKDMQAESLKTLGIIRGFTPYAFLDLVKAGKVSLEDSSNYQELLRKCIAGRIDGAYGNVAVSNWNLKVNLKESGALVFADKLPNSKGTYRLSSIRHPEVITQFNQWLTENKAAVDALKARYQVEQGVE